jgi:plastocyanin
MTKTKTIQSDYFTRCAWAIVAILMVTMLCGAASFSGVNLEATSATSASPDASSGSTAEVKIDNFAFTPAVITVKTGTQVTWINHDDIPHTVDSTQGKFKSAAMDTDDKFQFRFTEPGEYPFFCRMHPKMTGKIVVQ